MANLIALRGDKALAELTRDNALALRGWWRERVARGEAKGDTANKDFGHLSDVFGTLNDLHRMGLENPFKGLRLSEPDKAQRPSFSAEWIKAHICAPDALEALNDEARDVLRLMVNTGAGLAEIVGARLEDLRIDDPVPSLVIVAHEGRQLKTGHRGRTIPLLGVSLEAARRRVAAGGFPRYATAPDVLSATVNKFLLENKLRPTPRHTAYSLRHSFQDRMIAAELLDAMGEDLSGGRSIQLATPVHLDLSRREAQAVAGYSVARAIRAAVTNDWRDATLEREASEEIAHRAQRQSQGFYVPSFALARRDLLTSAELMGGALTGVDHLSDSFIEALRAETQVIGLGATVLPGLRRDASIPRLAEGATAQWVHEDFAADESAPRFDAVTLSYRHLTANVRYTRRMIVQGDPGIEQIFRDDLRAEVARGLDAAAIAGAGTALEPQGIIGAPGVLTVPHGDNGGAPSWATIVSLMAAVEGQNAGRGALGWLTNALVKAFLMGTPRVSGTDRMILNDDAGQVLAGHPFKVSNLVPNTLTKGTETGLSALIYGNWRDLLIGEFGGMELIVDPFTESTKGNVRITIHSFWDIAIRRPQSFAVAADLDVDG